MYPNRLCLIFLITYACGLGLALTSMTSVPITLAGGDEDKIVAALQSETAYFYRRDSTAWAGQWSHDEGVMKCYVRNGTYSEQLGWDDIRAAALAYMRLHPQPEPVPTFRPDYTIRITGRGAVVTYVYDDPQRGRKREVRFLVREQGRWKIAYMSTAYYP